MRESLLYNFFKVDPDIVLYASVSIRKHSFSRREVNSGNQTVSWPAASMWLITKMYMDFELLYLPHLIYNLPYLICWHQCRRHEEDESQKWIFGTDGCIYSKAYPQFVLTYLEKLTAPGDVSQKEDHIHHRVWTTAHQEHDRPCVEEKKTTTNGIVQPTFRGKPFFSDSWKLPPSHIQSPDSFWFPVAHGTIHTLSLSFFFCGTVVHCTATESCDEKLYGHKRFPDVCLRFSCESPNLFPSFLGGAP
ncbi:doublecortin domain-containing protein 5 [Cricetulus griseus]|nr:doublecortin domain-containing protein 5 [Cricetulus griseus]